MMMKRRRRKVESYSIKRWKAEGCGRRKWNVENVEREKILVEEDNGGWKAANVGQICWKTKIYGRSGRKGENESISRCNVEAGSQKKIVDVGKIW